MGNCIQPASSLQVQPKESLQSITTAVTSQGDNGSVCHYQKKLSRESEAASNEGTGDAIHILSKFNITNMRILVKAMGNSWVKLHKIVECMIKTCRTSDYFYLQDYTDQQIRDTLTEFFKLYLPTKMQQQNDTIYVSGIGIMSAAFHTCWTINNEEREHILFEMCSGADGLIHSNDNRIPVLISCLITFCCFSLEQYQLRASCDCLAFLDFKKKTS